MKNSESLDQKILDNEISVQETASVTRQYGKDGVDDPKEAKNELLNVRKFQVPPASVGVTMGLTLNLGNFESCRIDVTHSVPCYREESEDAYKYVRQFVETRLEKEVADIRRNKPSIF